MAIGSHTDISGDRQSGQDVRTQNGKYSSATRMNRRLYMCICMHMSCASSV